RTPRSARARLARVSREAHYLRAIEAKLRELVNAAVAARRPLPPGVVAGAGPRSLQLVDVADEVALTPLERLLELLELGGPALHLVRAHLHVRLELRLAQLQVAQALVDRLVRNRSRSRSGRQGRQRHPVEKGSEGACLLSRDLDPEDERLGFGSEIRFRHRWPHHLHRPMWSKPPSLDW